MTEPPQLRGNSASTHVTASATTPGLAALVSARDWSDTPLGPRAQWPAGLRSAVDIVLTSRFAMWMGWGPDLTFLYNDAYARMTLGRKHPWALGRPASEVWAEIWDAISVRIRQVMATNTATWDERLLLFLERSGFPEETYHTFSYSPLAGESGVVEGMLCVVVEETERVIGERRLGSLGELGSALATAATEQGVLESVASVIAANARDLPFALVYLYDFSVTPPVARLVSRTGMDEAHPSAPEILPTESDTASPWPAAAILYGDTGAIAVQLGAAHGTPPSGAWHEPARDALVVPISQPGQERPAGFFVAGLNPFRPLDDGYRGFVALFAGQIASSLSNARAYEQERKRAESLAELDRAKTQFFSNVSHEFRTPLTLMLAPIEDALGDTNTIPANRARFEVIHRNALRLLKLVNTLLDFSRIEAGRMQARFQATDLAALTADISSAFRSVMEQAGLELVVDAPHADAEAWVDRDMWEKVVLNLLSNAFKHTFTGRVEVALRPAPDHVTLTVRDSGIGIPAEHLPHLFERFHRVPNARSRTHEGTGIGLALVHELVTLHGGTIDVESEMGHGTTFTVSLPRGHAHLAPDHLVEGNAPPPARSPLRSGPLAYTSEAGRWINDAPRVTSQELQPEVSTDAPQETAAPRARILVVDDNADMREYVSRLLRERGWTVDTAADGNAALDSARINRPDLVLSDVMMPGLDGFGLLRALRNDPDMSLVPVILLSARAGEEARIEGLEAGVDDYLVKPFSSVELVARVGAHLALTAARNAAATDALAARREAEAANRTKGEFLAAMSHELRTPLNAIAGYVEILEMEIHGAVTDEQRGVLRRIQRSEQHLLSLITDVLNFAKLEAGRVEYYPARVALADIVVTTHGFVAPQMAAKQIAFVTNVGRDLTAWADEDKLGQVLVNLLSNAVKFTAPGGHVEVSAERCTTTNGDEVHVHVSDSGVGIPRDKQEAVFDPFVQVHRNLSRPIEGAGLGLAISRDLARGMGGDLRVRSEEGRGSVFTIVLPEGRKE